MLQPQHYINSTEFVEYCQRLETSTPLCIEKFVSSLDEHEFKLIFRQYLLNKYRNQNVTCISFIPLSDTHDHTYDDKHLQILKKFRTNMALQKNYFNDFNIPVYLLAYLFSFLSYNELCKLATVCSGFLFAKTKYSRLCHHHIELTHKFFVNIFRNQSHSINLPQHLSHFKYISIKSSYHSSEYDYRQKNHSHIFNYIIDTIIFNSQDTLQKLEIDIPMNQHYGNIYYDTKILLKYIMNKFNKLPALKQLYWREYVHVVSNSDEHVLFTDIKTKISKKFPNLQRLCVYNLSDLMIIIPKCNHLIHLSLMRFPIYNLFFTNRIILSEIARCLPNLQSLNICCTIEHERGIFPFDKNNYSNTMKTSQINQNMSLEIFSLSFLVNPTFKNRCCVLDSIIAYSFITFPNIYQFEFKFIYSSLFGLLNKRLKTPAIYRINWKKLFRLLINEKQKTLMANPLTVIKFNQISSPDACEAIHHISEIKSKYFRLEHFHANIVSFQGINAIKLNKIFKLINSLLLSHNHMKKLEIFTGKGYAHTQSPEQNEYIHNVFAINSLIYYTKYLQQILLLPMINLKYIHLQFTETKTNKSVSQQLAQFLTQISPQINNKITHKTINKICDKTTTQTARQMAIKTPTMSNNSIETIILEQVKISTKYKQFLNFWFKNSKHYYEFEQNKLNLTFFE